MKKILRYCYRALRNMSIFARLLVSYLIIIGLLNGVLIYFIYNRVEAEFYDSGINYVYQNLDIAADHVYDKLSVYEDYGEKLAAEKELISMLGSGTRNSREVEQFLYDHFIDDIAGLTLVTKDGVYKARSAEGAWAGAILARDDTKRIQWLLEETEESYLSKNWFNTVREDDTYIIKDYPKTYLGNYLTFTQKITNRNREKIGTLIFCVPTKVLAGSVKTNKIYGQDIFLCDDSGIIINLNTSFRYAEFSAEVWNGLSGQVKKSVFEYKINDKVMIFTTAQTGKGPLKVLGIMSKKDVMSKANTFMAALLIADFVMTAISLVICGVVTASITRPLKNLTEEVDRFGRSDFEFFYVDEGKDHIARVGYAFGEMAGRTKELTQQLMENERAIEKEKLRHTEMKVNALRLQINPHFLYNMLDLIRWNVVDLEKGNGRISRMIGGFSGMLKYNIRLGNGVAFVQEEIDSVYRYIKLVEELYDKKIEFSVDSGNLKTDQLKISKLLFQPIMENAVVHGHIHMREQPWMKVKISTEGNRLFIDFSNNGHPVEEEKMAEINERLQNYYEDYTGIGLGNVNLRIKLLFGREYGLRLELKNEITCVHVVLPLKEEDIHE